MVVISLIIAIIEAECLDTECCNGRFASHLNEGTLLVLLLLRGVTIVEHLLSGVCQLVRSHLVILVNYK